MWLQLVREQAYVLMLAKLMSFMSLGRFEADCD